MWPIQTPSAMVFGEDEEAIGRGDAGVGVGAEEVAVVGEEVRVDEETVVAQPEDRCEDSGRKAESKEGAQAIAGAGEEHPGMAGRRKMAVVLVRTMRGMRMPKSERWQDSLRTDLRGRRERFPALLALHS